MTADDVRLVVIETMNVLEHEYGAEDLRDFGPPTVDEIVEKIMGEHFPSETDELDVLRGKRARLAFALNETGGRSVDIAEQVDALDSEIQRLRSTGGATNGAGGGDA